MRTRTDHHAAGYSLTELLLAMGLFSLLGVGLVALLSRATDFLTAGASSTETMDALQTFSDSFGEDVTTLYTIPDSETGVPQVRLYSDYVKTDIDGDEKPDARIQRLCFVRLIPREATAALTRSAGTKIGAEGYMDQSNDVMEAAEGQLRATGGLMEAFWAAVPDSKDDVAVMRLYRGYRSPIGGTGSLLPLGDAAEPGTLPSERGPVHKAEIVNVAHAKPILSGVLHFGVEFWSRDTKTWDDQVQPRAGGALNTWDSTRGILPGLPSRSRDEGFFLAKSPESLADPTDDTFPRRLRVTLVVEEVGSNASVGFLVADLSQDAKTIDLSETGFIPTTESARRFVKIGAEWIRFEGVTDNGLTGCSRGQRGTLAQAHPAGGRVHHGRTVVREYGLAAFRDTYSDRLRASTRRR
jgi:hypothetical protein